MRCSVPHVIEERDSEGLPDAKAGEEVAGELRERWFRLLIPESGDVQDERIRDVSKIDPGLIAQLGVIELIADDAIDDVQAIAGEAAEDR